MVYREMSKTLLNTVRGVCENVLDGVIAGRIKDVERELKEMLQERLSGLCCDGWKRDVAIWRFKEVIRSERSQGNHTVVIEAKLSDKGLIGASSGVLASVLEVGITWDYIADLPLIPGSAIKGAVRNLLLSSCASLSDEDDRIKCLESISTLFGWTEAPVDLNEVANFLKVNKDVLKSITENSGVGLLIFHDTHLLCEEGCRLLEPWVITPHYRGAETEYDARPIPVEHVVLRKGLKGYFVVGVHRSALGYLSMLWNLLEGKKCEELSCLLFLAKVIAAALSSSIGARSARGYTRFEVIRVHVG